MCGRPSTTVGFERLFNPLARLERKPFLENVLNGQPARPLNMTAIYATNRGVVDQPWAMLTTSPAVDEVPLDALEARTPETVVLDVREPEEYAHGHVPGALNVPQADLATRLDELPRGRPILAICQSGRRSLRSAQFLKQAGFQSVASVRGGTEAWQEAGQPLAYGDTSLEPRRIAETLWTHGGALDTTQVPVPAA
jgi:rhodanese-related sulfurtransferase